jgi:RNA polymerase primary sigma factor
MTTSTDGTKPAMLVTDAFARWEEGEISAREALAAIVAEEYVAADAAFKTAEQRQVEQALFQQLGREPDEEELAMALDVPIAKVRRMVEATRLPVSLDTPLGPNQEGTLEQIIPDTAAAEPGEQAFAEERSKVLRAALRQLTAREREVLELRYGVHDGHPRTLDAVGQFLGVSRERVRQIEAKALRKLRHPACGRRLRGLTQH